MCVRDDSKAYDITPPAFVETAPKDEQCHDEQGDDKHAYQFLGLRILRRDCVEFRRAPGFHGGGQRDRGGDARPGCAA